MSRTRLSARAAIAATSVLLCLAGRIHGQNGNATISAPGLVFGQPLTLSTSSQFAGAVSSIKWGNREFINNWDHGRQLQVNAQFFNRFECYNPYEAGTKEDQNFPTSSSHLLSLSANGNTLDSTTQMSWYLSSRVTRPGFGDYCGDPNNWLPVPPYTGPLSDYRVHKTVRIGFAGLPNVIEYLSELYIPEHVLKGLNQLIAVTPYDFSSVWSYDVVSKEYRTVRGFGGEDDRIKVVSTADGAYALGFYSPELLQSYNSSGAVNFWNVVPPNPLYPDPKDPTRPDPDFGCVHVGSFNHYESFNGPGFLYDRAYLVIGNLEQVRTSLADLHLQFRALDPDVFNWRDYVTINGLESFFPTQQSAENHWLTHGIAEGRRASRTFSASQYLQLNPDLAGFFGATNYQAAIEHYVSNGRSEGRGTVVRPATGMQHLVVLSNGNATAAGQNSSGQIGNGNISGPLGKTPVNLPHGATEVAAGDYTSLAVTNDGSLWVWGSNQYGARGDGSSGGAIANPVQVPIAANISTPPRSGKHAIAVGIGCYAAIDKQGQVWTWGVNWNGRLGDGSTVSRFTPGRVKKSAAANDYLTGIVSIAAGGGTFAAIDADGAVWTWGAGANGALGNGSTNDSGYPVQVVQAGSGNSSTPLTGISQVACGSSGFCIALLRYGQVVGWGSNDFSQMGIPPGGALSIATPIPVGPNGIDAIAAGSAHGLAHSVLDGKVYGWGYNGYGQLGNGSVGVAQYPPAVMSSGPDGMQDVSDLSACSNFSAIVRFTDRALFVTGDNQSGQLGISGNPLSLSVPVKSSFP